MYAEETQKIAQVLQDAGITDELLEELAVRLEK
jgi:Tfp pilus assembly protein PilN